MNQTSATFLDARTGRNSEVQAVMSFDSLSLVAADGHQAALWPYDKITLVERVYNSDRLVVGHLGNDISRLSLFEPAFAFQKALIERAPRLKAALREGKLRRFLIWIGWIPRDS